MMIRAVRSLRVAPLCAVALLASCGSDGTSSEAGDEPATSAPAASASEAASAETSVGTDETDAEIGETDADPVEIADETESSDGSGSADEEATAAETGAGGADSDSSAESTTPPATPPAGAEEGGTARDEPVEAAVDPGRIVVVGEEGVLADVLALGVPVVASSATVPSAGFQGMGDVDTDGIEIFDYLNISLEELAAYRADRVIVWEFIVDRVGEEQLAGIGAELIVLPDGSSNRDRLELLGDAFGQRAVADDMIADLDAAYEDARPSVGDDCAVSVAAIYAGPNVAAFAAPVWDVPRALDELGCDLVPAASDVETDGNGRAWLSLEQLGLLEGPSLILLQTDTVEGERESIDEVTDQPLWATLPAVAAGDVTELDRLGYAGIAGEMRLIDDLVDVVGNAP